MPSGHTLQVSGADTIQDTLDADLQVLSSHITAWAPPEPSAPISDANWTIFDEYITVQIGLQLLI